MLSMKRIDPKIPVEIVEQLTGLGLRIRAARTRRRMRQEDLARSSGLSRTAIEAVERGEPTTAMGTYLKVLWALGLNREVDLVADPGLDRDGLSLEFSVQSKRVGVARKVDNDF